MSPIDGSRKTSLRKVTIITTGSRGDIQPFVAIGISLKRAGYTVRVLTNPSETHTMLLNDFGLEHVPYGVDVDQYILKDKLIQKSMETGDVMTLIKGLDRAVLDNTELYCQPFHDHLIEKTQRPDLLIVSILDTFFGLYAKHVLRIPTIEINLFHFVFDNPNRAPIGLPTLPLGMHKYIETKMILPGKYNKYDKLVKVIGSIQKTDSSETICLNNFLLFDQFLESVVNHSPLLPRLVAQSSHFKDILCPTIPPSSKIRFVGPAIIEKDDQLVGDAQSFGDDSERMKLKDFISLDPDRKPVYMGWGSMIRKSTHKMVLFAVEALRISNSRGIILGGTAGLSMKKLEDAVAARNVKNYEDDNGIIEYARENVIFVDKAPHEWLFPQVSLTVHHGGAGTTNAALLSGVPTIITPVFVDQFDNAFVVQNLGVGIGFEQQLHKIDAKSLSEAIIAVTNDSTIATRAKEVAEQIRDQPGCRTILEEIQQYWTHTVATGEFLKEIQDWKLATKERKFYNEKRTLRNRIMFGSAFAIAGIAFMMK